MSLRCRNDQRIHLLGKHGDRPGCNVPGYRKRPKKGREVNPSLQKKVYLGDAVYASVENGMILLTTEDGNRVLNEIFLEPEVFHALVQWEKALQEAEIE